MKVMVYEEGEKCNVVGGLVVRWFEELWDGELDRGEWRWGEKG